MAFSVLFSSDATQLFIPFFLTSYCQPTVCWREFTVTLSYFTFFMDCLSYELREERQPVYILPKEEGTKFETNYLVLNTKKVYTGL